MGVALATTAVSGSSCFFVAVAASAATAMDADAAMTAVSGSSCFFAAAAALAAITMDATADADANPFLTKKNPAYRIFLWAGKKETEYITPPPFFYPDVNSLTHPL